LAGDALAQQLPLESTIALGPAGYIPYRTGLVTYDLLGITDRHIAHRKLAFSEGYAGHEKHDGAYILSLRPDYLLLGNVDITDQPRRGFIPPFTRELDIYQNPIFQADYELVSLPVGLLTANLLYINQFPDRKADIQAHKLHWVARLSPDVARWGYVLIALLAWLTLAILVVVGTLPLLALVSVLPALLSIKAARILVRNAEMPQNLVPAIQMTILAMLGHGALLTLALVLDSLVRA